MSVHRWATFDIFDTLLTRAVSPPVAVFQLLGLRLREHLSPLTPDVFAETRRRAEERAFANLGICYTLAAIYQEVAAAMCWSPADREHAMAEELKLEGELLKPIPVGRQHLETARAQGRRIAFVSDMYLPSDFLQSLLSQHRMWQSDDRLFVSCDHGQFKVKGRLFQLVFEQLGASPAHAVHFGNDPRADVSGARAASLTPVHVDAANDSRYETALATANMCTQGLSQLMAGSSKLSRLEVGAVDQRQQAIRDVSAGVAGPALSGYVLWLLHQARCYDLKRLYFVARDGQVLIDIARPLVAAMNLPIELRYLHGSRRAWAVTAVGNSDAWLWDNSDQLTVRILLKRLGLEVTEVKPLLDRAGLPESRWDLPLSRADRAQFEAQLKSPEFATIRATAAAAHQRLFADYLRQEGFDDGTPAALVDIGWRGTLHDVLLQTLEREGMPPVRGLYLGLERNVANDLREAWLHDEAKKIGFNHRLPDMGKLLIEMFCTADHGTVVGFRAEGGQVIPVFQEAVNRAAVTWGLPYMRTVLVAFATHLANGLKWVTADADVRDGVINVLSQFFTEPTREEALAWGAYPMEIGQADESLRASLAEPYRAADLLQVLRQGQMPRHHSMTWIEGSIALSGPVIRSMSRRIHVMGKLSRRIMKRIRKQ